MKINKIIYILCLVTASSSAMDHGAWARRALGNRGNNNMPGAAQRDAMTQEKKEQVKQLWIACKAGDEAKAAKLLQAGVDPNTRLFADPTIFPNVVEAQPAGAAVLDEVGHDNSTCLHYAAHAGHLGIVNLLFEHRVWTNLRDQNGWIPMIGALVAGHEKVVDRLIAKGAKIESIDAVLGYRPIATPVQCLHPRLVHRLLQAGAAVLPPVETWHNNVPLQRIYQGGALHILCERLQCRPVHAPEYGAQETEDRALEIIEIVRAHGIDRGHQDADGNTVFHAAARLNDKRIMAALMVSSNYAQAIKQVALARLKAFLLVNQRIAFLPQDVFLRIFSYMPIECKQAGIEQLVVPHCTDVVTMRTRHLDACLVDLKKYSFHTADEGLEQVKLLGILNEDQEQACDVTQDAVLKQVLNPITWH